MYVLGSNGYIWVKYIKMKNLVKVLAVVFMFLSSNVILSQVTRFNKQLNIEGLEELDNVFVKQMRSSWNDEINSLMQSYDDEIKKMAKEFQNKVKRYGKEERRQTQKVNLERVKEVEGMERKIISFREAAQADIKYKEYSMWFEKLLNVAQNENAALIIEKDTVSQRIFIDRKQGPIIIRQGYDIQYQPELTIRDYFEKNGTSGLEGIWEVNLGADTNTYRLAIFKSSFKYNVFVIRPSLEFKMGDLKGTIESAATDEIVTINWLMGDKITRKKAVGTVTNNSLIEFKLENTSLQLYKVYPKLGKNKKIKTGEWAGNGSGIIISKSGYIVTNHHVIEDADNIEVEFIIDGEVKKFNAEIVQSDKTNDLAIIKIFDMNFEGLDDLPYNFKTRSSDVGTKVYAYGYPMALTVMGKEIKITDGIISSKSGYDGNITTYQITAPIQGGNSGGPLFDDKGNFIGINSSGLSKDIADNVGYSIKSSYVLNLIDVLPKGIELPSNTKLQSLPLTEQIKEISKYVVLVKVK